MFPVRISIANVGEKSRYFSCYTVTIGQEFVEYEKAS